MATTPLILASRSAQRRAILEQLGLAFSVWAPDVEEVEAGPPQLLAAENASRKAAAGAAAHPRRTVLAADTIVALDGRIHSKPRDREHARAILAALSGRRHEVIGGLCLIRKRESRVATATTAVEFRALGDSLIDWYLESGEWRGRAGAYAIQGRGAALVAGIEGDYLNVVGLPVARLLELAPDLLDA